MGALKKFLGHANKIQGKAPGLNRGFMGRFRSNVGGLPGMKTMKFFAPGLAAEPGTVNQPGAIAKGYDQPAAMVPPAMPVARTAPVGDGMPPPGPDVGIHPMLRELMAQDRMTRR